MKILLVLLAFSAALFASPDPTFQCQLQNSKILNKSVRYCIERSRPHSAPAPQEPVIYFFHGMGGSATSWQENGYQEAFRYLSDKESFPQATVVSFDTEESSFFSDYGGVTSGEQAYETWFIKEFIPFIEKKFGVCSTRNCRALAGLSMGGFGALKTALKYPNMFFSVAVNCPALSPFNVHESNWKWNDYFNRHPIGPMQGHFMLNYIRGVFPTNESYDNNDPASLIEKFEKGATLPTLYFDVGGKDYFGFQEGFGRFEKALRSKGFYYTSYYDPNADHEIFRNRKWDLLKFLKAQIP